MKYYKIKNKTINLESQSISTELRYIVETTSDNGVYIKGDRFDLEYEKAVDEWNENKVRYKFLVFSPPPNPDVESFFGMKRLNSVTSYQTEAELIEALKGIKLIPNMEYYKNRKDVLLNELKELDELYAE